MRINKTLKLLTLFGFCVFLSAFVAFKAGIFDKYLGTESRTTPMPRNEQAINVEAIYGDTLPVKKADSIKVNPTMLSTSKSLIVVDQKIEFPIKDTLKGDSLKLTPKK